MSLSEAGKKFWDILTKSLSEGMNPDDVGSMVLDAVVNKKFWA
jgi:hypothetical protein